MIGLIVARSKNNVIGKNGNIPWKIKGEQKQFRELTTGNVVIMGRKSYEEIGHPLPNRMNIVVSTTTEYQGDNLVSVKSLEDALLLAKGRDVYEIALDDVGAGYSGLNRVVNTSPNYLKVDIELVRDIQKHKKKEIMMEFLLHYCNETGAILIAEGIETEAELECLCRLGVHYGQGYFLGRPDRTFKNVRNEAMLVLRRLNNKS